MLAVAARERAALDASMRDRVSLAQATADRLPFDDGAFDIVVTAFVLQLVPSRYRALREARRVLGWHGALAQATWLAGGSFPADDAYADALVAAGLEPREAGGAHDEPGSPAAAAAQLRRAGFSGVTARPGEVDHRFTPEGFLAFLACFDDEELFATLEPTAREALEADLLERLRALPAEGLRMRLPIAVVTGRRPARP
jgi:SAM-dependent methyltransferase